MVTDSIYASVENHDIPTDFLSKVPAIIFTPEVVTIPETEEGWTESGHYSDQCECGERQLPPVLEVIDSLHPPLVTPSRAIVHRKIHHQIGRRISRLSRYLGGSGTEYIRISIDECIISLSIDLYGDRETMVSAIIHAWRDDCGV